MILRIVPSEAERVAESLGSETVEQAGSSFRINGALIIENIVDAAIIAQARRAFDERYSHYLNHSDPESMLMVGARRLQITIKLEPPFDNFLLFANPYLLPVIAAELGEGFVLGSYKFYPNSTQRLDEFLLGHLHALNERGQLAF